MMTIEERREYQRKWREANRERIREYSRMNYRRNRERYNARSKEYYLAHKEECCRKMREYRLSHLEYFREYERDIFTRMRRKQQRDARRKRKEAENALRQHNA